MIEEIPGDLLQWLRGFYHVADRGSITQATGAMGREQPTITRQIKCLEKELGTTLFDRSSGKMKLTPEGRILFDKAISLFEDVREIRSIFKKELLGYQGTISFAAGYASIDNFLSPYIVNFRHSHPGDSFNIQGTFFQTVYEKVDSGEVDFGITLLESFPSTLLGHDLFETGQKLIAPKGHRFFSGKNPTLKQIAEAPLILFSRTGVIEPFVEQSFAKEGLTPNVVMTFNNFSSMKKFVGLGLGVAIVSDYAVSAEDEKTLDVISLDDQFRKRRVGILLRKRKYHAPAVQAFLRTLKPDIPFGK